jgi:hypothetical protein
MDVAESIDRRCKEQGQLTECEAVFEIRHLGSVGTTEFAKNDECEKWRVRSSSQIVTSAGEESFVAAADETEYRLRRRTVCDVMN